MCYVLHIYVLRVCSPHSTFCRAIRICSVCEDAALMWRASTNWKILLLSLGDTSQLCSDQQQYVFGTRSYTTQSSNVISFSLLKGHLQTCISEHVKENVESFMGLWEGDLHQLHNYVDCKTAPNGYYTIRYDTIHCSQEWIKYCSLRNDTEERGSQAETVIFEFCVV